MILPFIENTNSLANSVFMQIRFSTAMVPTTFCKNLTNPLITCCFSDFTSLPTSMQEEEKRGGGKAQSSKLEV